MGHIGKGQNMLVYLRCVNLINYNNCLILIGMDKWSVTGKQASNLPWENDQIISHRKRVEWPVMGNGPNDLSLKKGHMKLSWEMGQMICHRKGVKWLSTKESHGYQRKWTK